MCMETLTRVKGQRRLWVITVDTQDRNVDAIVQAFSQLPMCAANDDLWDEIQPGETQTSRKLPANLGPSVSSIVSLNDYQWIDIVWKYTRGYRNGFIYKTAYHTWTLREKTYPITAGLISWFCGYSLKNILDVRPEKKKVLHILDIQLYVCE